jgi:hypothetical protein
MLFLALIFPSLLFHLANSAVVDSVPLLESAEPIAEVKMPDLLNLAFNKSLKLNVQIRPFTQFFQVKTPEDCIDLLAMLFLQSLRQHDTAHFTRSISAAYDESIAGLKAEKEINEDKLKHRTISAVYEQSLARLKAKEDQLKPSKLLNAFFEQKISPDANIEMTLIKFLLRHSIYGILMNRNDSLTPLFKAILDSVNVLAKQYFPQKSGKIRILIKVFPSLKPLRYEFRETVYEAISWEILYSEMGILYNKLKLGEILHNQKDLRILKNFYLNNTYGSWFDSKYLCMAEIGYTKNELEMINGLFTYLIEEKNYINISGYFSANPKQLKTLVKLLDPGRKNSPLHEDLIVNILKGLFVAFANKKFEKPLMKLAKVFNLYLASASKTMILWEDFIEFLFSMSSLRELEGHRIEYIGVGIFRAYYQKLTLGEKNFEWVGGWVGGFEELTIQEKNCLEKWRMNFLGFKGKIFDSTHPEYARPFLIELCISKFEALECIVVRSMMEVYTSKKTFAESFNLNLQVSNLQSMHEKDKTFSSILSCLMKCKSIYEMFVKLNAGEWKWFSEKLLPRFEALLPCYSQIPEPARIWKFLSSVIYFPCPLDDIDKFAFILEKAYFRGEATFDDARYINDLPVTSWSWIKDRLKSLHSNDIFGRRIGEIATVEELLMALDTLKFVAKDFGRNI